MLVRRTIEAGGYAPETRYAFEDHIEAMLTLGVLGAVMERAPRNMDGYVLPGISKDRTVAVDDFDELHESVRIRRIGFGDVSAMDGVEDYLTHTESNRLWRAVAWAGGHLQIEAALRSDTSFPAAVAGGLILSNSIINGERLSMRTGTRMLDRLGKDGSLGRVLGMRFPEAVISREISYRDGNLTVPQAKVTVATSKPLL